MIPHPRHAERCLGSNTLCGKCLQRIIGSKKPAKIFDLGDIISKNIPMDKAYSYNLCSPTYSFSLISSQGKAKPVVMVGKTSCHFCAAILGPMAQTPACRKMGTKYRCSR